MSKTIYFDLPYLYYLPHYQPVYAEFKRQGVDCLFVPYEESTFELLRQVIEEEQIPATWVKDRRAALALYRNSKPDWVIFANGFKYLDDIPETIGTALINHGAGVKSAGHSVAMCRMTVRFVEGPYQMDALKRSFPRGNYVEVGYSKLDPLFDPDGQKPCFDLKAVGLSPDRPTLLYAPTFYPSSIERMADTWPEEFSGYNLLIKPHFFTYTKPRYKMQRKKIERWRKAKNVYVPPITAYNLLPFMTTADLLMSDASTALFEFATLNKPVVWCDFLKLRWTYWGPLRYRFVRRMDQNILRYADIAVHAKNYGELKAVVKEQLENPSMYEKKRHTYCRDLLGITDGKVSKRIVDYLLGEPVKERPRQ
jgi:hypothetical protein